MQPQIIDPRGRPLRRQRRIDLPPDAQRRIDRQELPPWARREAEEREEARCLGFFPRRGGGDPTPIFDLDFTGGTPGVFTGHAGLDLTFTRASAAALVQVSASAMSAAEASNNEGLLKSRGVAGRVGHLVRRAFTNKAIRAHALGTTGGAGGWTAGTAAYSSCGDSPRSGVTDAQRIECDVGEYCHYFDGGTLSALHTASFWRRANSGTVTHHAGYGNGPPLPGAGVYTGSATATWEKVALTNGGDGTNTWFLVPVTSSFGTFASGIAQDVCADLVQIVVGRIAYDCVLTTGSTITSAAETLYSGGATSATDSGYLGLWYQVMPEADSGAYVDHGDMCLWDHVHGAGLHSRCKVAGATRVVTLTLYGASPVVTTFATPLPTWSEGDALDIWVEGRDGDQRGKARVNGGVVTDLGSATNTGVSLGATANLYHLSTDGGAEQCDFAVMRARGYPFNARPGWAA